MLNPRQRNQIKAALTFWNAVAETSRVHPMEHPKVQPYFRDGGLSSLTTEEIDDLLTLFDKNFDWRSLVTLLYIARVMETSVARLRAQVKRDGVKPIEFQGCSIGLYYPCDLIQSVRRIRERDAQMEQKYHAKTKPPPTSDD